jgi:hypothetical protein
MGCFFLKNELVVPRINPNVYNMTWIYGILAIREVMGVLV